MLNHYDHHIKIDNCHRGHGYVSGTIDCYKWYALVSRTDEYRGINPITLERGLGHIMQLVLYDETVRVIGNPYQMTKRISKTIHIEYLDGWKRYDSSYSGYIRELVTYLDKRAELKIV